MKGAVRPARWLTPITKLATIWPVYESARIGRGITSCGSAGLFVPCGWSPAELMSGPEFTLTRTPLSIYTLSCCLGSVEKLAAGCIMGNVVTANMAAVRVLTGESGMRCFLGKMYVDMIPRERWCKFNSSFSSITDNILKMCFPAHVCSYTYVGNPQLFPVKWHSH